jgi:transcriptional regulator with XRE-family HTH domain
VTGNQLRKIIEGLGISQAALAKDIGISDRQMRRYCAMGKAHIPVVVECAVMWIRSGSREGHEDRTK